jgi:hypothetical protein
LAEPATKRLYLTLSLKASGGILQLITKSRGHADACHASDQQGHYFFLHTSPYVTRIN